MDDWIKQEHNHLTQLAQRALVKANLLVGLTVLALIVGFYLTAEAIALPFGIVASVLLFFMLLGPPLFTLLVNRVRSHLWRRAVAGRIRRLRAMGFLSSYVDTLDREALAQLPEGIRETLDEVLEKEREGRLPPSDRYADALFIALAVDAETSARMPRRRRRGDHP